MMAINSRDRANNNAQPYALAFFRVAFGLLILVAELRFIGRGWVTEFYVKPRFFFSFYGFDWVRPLPQPYIDWVFYGLVLLSGLIALGLFYRASIIAFFTLFTYVELLDKSVYLNHYYQVSLLAFLLCWLPMHRVVSVDAWLHRKGWLPRLPSLSFAPFRLAPRTLAELLYNPVWLIRLQVGSVYFFGGLAKLRYDWLFMGQPLHIWLAANEHLPLVGSLLTQPWVAFGLSWLAMLFDLSAPFLLSFRQTRLPAFVLLVVFHLLTHLLFYIGMFPWLMMVTALIFFPPTLFQRLLTVLPGLSKNQQVSPSPTVGLHWPTRLFRGVIVVFGVWQVLLPFRSYLYPGNVLWHEQGFRFSWNIMLMEKNASLDYTVRVKKTGLVFAVKPTDFLTRIQARQLSFQPDMIAQFARYLHGYYLESGVGDTEIRADCYASLNGRGSALLIDPTVDLARQPDGFKAKRWITKLD